MTAQPLSDVDIAELARDLRTDYAAAFGDPGPRLPISSLVSDYLEARDNLTLDITATLGVNETGDQIAGLLILEPTGGAIKIDRAIADSPMFPFTLGHEVGHWILHQKLLRQSLETSAGHDPALVTLRRDVGGTKQGKTLEWQANRFATHLLMPGDLVALEFRKRYGTVTRRYTDQSPSFYERWPKRREYASFMATKGQSRPMSPLSLAFGVSQTALAIRLEELDLV